MSQSHSRSPSPMDIDPAVELAVLEAEDLHRAEESNRRRQELLELARQQAAEKKAREEAAEARRREEEAEARKKEEAAKKAAEIKAQATKPKSPKKVSSTSFLYSIYSFVFIV